MRKKSELDSLLNEYRILKKIPTYVVNDTLIHNTDFHCWLANVVIDTVNYENLLFEILNNEFNGVNINAIAEIHSRPILSVSEKISSIFVPTTNYSSYASELGEIDDYQACNRKLITDINFVDLLIGQSNQYENLKKQRDKLTVIRSFTHEQQKPFIVGCYGNSNSENFQRKIEVLKEFEERLDFDVKVYNETYNGVDCKVLVKK